MHGLILNGWIRGIEEDKKKHSFKVIEHYQSTIRRVTKRDVRLFKFGDGAGLFVTEILGADVIEVAQTIALQVSQLSHDESFYVACSFRVGLLEENILDDVRSAKILIDNHKRLFGACLVDGKLLPLYRIMER